MLPDKDTRAQRHKHTHTLHVCLENEVSAGSVPQQLQRLLTLNHILGFVGHSLGDAVEIVLHLNYYVK